MKKNTIAKQRVKIILVVPLGVEERIFPWGIHSIKDYLRSSCDSLDLEVWDNRSDPFFAEVNKRYGNLLSKLFLSLKVNRRKTFFGATRNPYVFLGIAACTGDNFLKAGGLNRLFRRSYSRNLRTLQREMNAHIIDKIREYIENSPGAIRIWAFSVYDYTLFNSLYFARLIKENDPGASIIFGGDYFNFQSAKKIINGIPFIDGIVVGYGEEVMRRIVSDLQQGNPIDTLEIQGLVNKNGCRSQGFPPGAEEVNLPPLYKELPTAPVISYVQQRETGEIRILAQRGCSWGKCVFCTQIDKNMFFPVSVEHLLQETRAAVRNAKPKDKESSIKISFDSDENSPEMFNRIITYLDSIKDRQIRIHIILWLQVKMFRKEIAEILSKIDNKKIHVHFKLNFESLNFDTLKNMRKGHTPLQAIEAAKAIQDSGHTFISNYFMHFPMENNDSIGKETEILKRVVHLLSPPKGGIILFPYESNDRDAIYRNQEKYKIEIRRWAEDNWLLDTFGVDLPFSIWSHVYTEKTSLDPGHLLVYTYFQSIKANDEVYAFRRTAGMNWGKEKMPPGEKIAFVYRLLKFYGWEGLYRVLLSTGKGKALGQRSRLFKYLSKINEANPKDPTVCRSYFFLKDSCLYKEFNVPGSKEKWSLRLDRNELKVLRYLYWIRRRKHVIERFENEMNATDITALIDRHLELGSLVRFKDFLLCVVNDPGYWK